MSISDTGSLACAGCRNLISANTSASDVVVLTPFPFRPGRVHGQPAITLHRDKDCAQRLYLKPHTSWCPRPLDLEDEITADVWQATGWFVEGLGDDRGFVRLHYVGQPVGVAA